MAAEVVSAMVTKGGDEEYMELPPGFRFHPTDEEIITHYLSHKFMNSSFSATTIGEADFNKCEPWDLPKKAKMEGEKEWYFFCKRDRKYPTGMRTNRATEAGYWKATGKDKEIHNKGRSKGKGSSLVIGMKKTLVFYRGRAPKGDKTNWVMHEYRLLLQPGHSYHHHLIPKAEAAATAPSKDEWVVCRVFHKNSSGTEGGVMNKRSPIPIPIHAGLLRINSFSFVDDLDLLLDSPSLPPLLDFPYLINTTTTRPQDKHGDEYVHVLNNNKIASTRTSADSSHHLSYCSTSTGATEGMVGHHHQPLIYEQEDYKSFHQHQVVGSPPPDHPNLIYYPPHHHHQTFTPQNENENPLFSFEGSSKSSSWLHHDDHRDSCNNIINNAAVAATMIPCFPPLTSTFSGINAQSCSRHHQ